LISAGEVLEMARGLLDRAEPVSSGLWPRAVALLGRQALEMSMDELWRQRGVGMEQCSTHAQLLCLSLFIEEPLAERADYAWRSLSRACHHHAYELAPTDEELRSWLADVDAVIAGGVRDASA
jgi:hypothetical protein